MNDDNFDNYIIFYDEIHTLWKEGTKHTKLNDQIRQSLTDRKNTLLIGATATPFVNNNEEDFDKCMQVIMGDGNVVQSHKIWIITYFSLKILL